MVPARKKYTREFKLDALQMAEVGDRSIAQVERDLGLGQGQIHHWRKQLAAEGMEAFPGKGHLLPPEDKIRQLEREIEVLRQERDILKKALAIFSQTASRP